MLTEQQWEQLDEIFRKTGLGVRMLAKDTYIIVDANHQRISRDEYTSHADAALALINGAYKAIAPRVETCVQHGARNKPQRRAEMGMGVGNPMLGG
jgi:hypothetical protein